MFNLNGLQCKFYKVYRINEKQRSHEVRRMVTILYGSFNVRISLTGDDRHNQRTLSQLPPRLAERRYLNVLPLKIIIFNHNYKFNRSIA